MPVMTEEPFVTRPLVTSREPVGPKNAASKGSVGDVALMDAVAIVVAAWVLLFLLGFSLRSHNI
jgi:hypothetical protein